MIMSVISATNVSKKYPDSTVALDELSVEVPEGSIYGLLGENGAGKTTLINIFTGQIAPTSGDVSVLDVDPVESPVESRVGVGVLPEKEAPLKNLTPVEQFQFVGEVRGMSSISVKQQTEVWLDRLELVEKRDTLNRELSRGQQQKVMFASAFLHSPALVFIDEPLVNLDPRMQNIIKEFLKEYNSKGNTIMLSTHYVEAAVELCDTIGVMQDGSLIAEGSSEEIGSVDAVEQVLERTA